MGDESKQTVELSQAELWILRGLVVDRAQVRQLEAGRLRSDDQPGASTALEREHQQLIELARYLEQFIQQA